MRSKISGDSSTFQELGLCMICLGIMSLRDVMEYRKKKSFVKGRLRIDAEKKKGTWGNILMSKYNKPFLHLLL